MTLQQSSLQLPSWLATPLAMIPNSLHSAAFIPLLNKVFSEQLAYGELEWLDEKIVEVKFRDAKMAYHLTLDMDENGTSKISPPAHHKKTDLTISGDLYDFLLLASGKDDPDTLFFQRRLKLDGDVELGLEVKNFLYGLELDTLPIPEQARTAMEYAIKGYEKLFS